MAENGGLTYEQQRALAWKLHQEMLEVFPGEPTLYDVENIIEMMQSIAHARAKVPKVEE